MAVLLLVVLAAVGVGTYLVGRSKRGGRVGERFDRGERAIGRRRARVDHLEERVGGVEAPRQRVAELEREREIDRDG